MKMIKTTKFMDIEVVYESVEMNVVHFCMKSLTVFECLCNIS